MNIANLNTDNSFFRNPEKSFYCDKKVVVVTKIVVIRCLLVKTKIKLSNDSDSL